MKYVAVQAYNKKLLSNILPVHVAEFFMSGDKNNDVSNGTAHAKCALTLSYLSTIKAVLYPQRFSLPFKKNRCAAHPIGYKSPHQIKMPFGALFLTLFYTRGLGIIVSHVMVPLPYRFSL